DPRLGPAAGDFGAHSASERTQPGQVRRALSANPRRRARLAPARAARCRADPSPGALGSAHPEVADPPGGHADRLDGVLGRPRSCHSAPGVAESGGQQRRQEGGRDLVADVSEEARHTDASDPRRRPSGREGRLRWLSREAQPIIAEADRLWARPAILSETILSETPPSGCATGQEMSYRRNG
ncbi:MAG: hypothetical protein QOJ19_1330, partial [Acidimicrobiia bacterium]|nr:hypothetical protein [Acidimicrobiia bacterium]